MKWYTKLFLWLIIAIFVAIMLGMVYVVWAKYRIDDYKVQLTTSLNAAMIVNAEETFTDPESAVICEYDGARVVLAPENYRALTNYLTADSAPPLFARVDKQNSLHISLCGHEHIYVEGDEDGDGVTIRFESREHTYIMHVGGYSDLWNKLLTLCSTGTNRNPNIVIE